MSKLSLRLENPQNIILFWNTKYSILDNLVLHNMLTGFSRTTKVQIPMLTGEIKLSSPHIESVGGGKKTTKNNQKKSV